MQQGYRVELALLYMYCLNHVMTGTTHLDLDLEPGILQNQKLSKWPAAQYQPRSNAVNNHINVDCNPYMSDRTFQGGIICIKGSFTCQG